MVKTVTGDHQRKTVVGPRQRQGIPHQPVQVGQPLFLLPLLCLFDHGRGDVDAGHLPGIGGKGTGHQPWPAGHVKHGVAFTGLRHLQQQFQGIQMPRQPGKGDGLLGKLLHNLFLMATLHSYLLRHEVGKLYLPPSGNLSIVCQ